MAAQLTVTRDELLQQYQIVMWDGQRGPEYIAIDVTDEELLNSYDVNDVK